MLSWPIAINTSYTANLTSKFTSSKSFSGNKNIMFFKIIFSKLTTAALAHHQWHQEKKEVIIYLSSKILLIGFNHNFTVNNSMLAKFVHILLIIYIKWFKFNQTRYGLYSVSFASNTLNSSSRHYVCLTPSTCWVETEVLVQTM